MRPVCCILCVAIAMSSVATLRGESAEPVRIVRYGDQAGSAQSDAVRVENADLVHTTQLLPVDAKGELTGSSAEAQCRSVLASVDTILREFGAAHGDVVKVNLYVANARVREVAVSQLRKAFAADARPAVSCVQTVLPQAGALVAADAVIAVPARNLPPVARHRHLAELGGTARQSHATILPRGDVVYVSGQAEPGELAPATRATLVSLQRTLRYLNLNREQIVSLKCFLAPMERIDVVNREIAAFFGDADVPPVAHVEWIAGSLPIEIELIAAAPRTEADNVVTFATPPGLKASPVFSRVSRIHGDKRIYVTGLYAAEAGDGAEQTRQIFDRLDDLLGASGSDMRHLAKATYYVSDDDASKALNQLRPSIYDPARPPAASKALVSGVGREGRTITMDMIAAPVPMKP